MIFKSDSVEATEKIGKAFGEKLKNSDKTFLITMYGDLGAGKTAFVRGMASVLSPGSRVKSPTYTLVNEYRKGEKPLFHFDLYRIDSITELDAIGFDEYIDKGNCIIEWSEKLGDNIPGNAIIVKIEKNDEINRTIYFENIGGDEL